MTRAIPQIIALGLVALVVGGHASSQVSQRVSLDGNGAQIGVNSDISSGSPSTVSDDGRFVVFSTYAGLDPNDTNGTWDVYVRDRLLSTTEWISQGIGTLAGNGQSGSYGVSISGDGRYVVFDSQASNLVVGDTNGVRDIFLRDRLSQSTERVSVSTFGTQGNGNCFESTISRDGRFVGFDTLATNLFPNDINGTADIVVRDLVASITVVASTSSSGALGNGDSLYPFLSPDGHYVAFASAASNLVLPDTNNTWDVFVRDLVAGTTVRASVGVNGVQGNATSWMPRLSSDGRLVAFQSQATNLVSGDTNAHDDVFIRDLQTNTTVRASVGPGGVQADGTSALPSFSADGRYLAFKSNATNLVAGSTGGTGFKIIVRDLLAGTNEIASVASDGTIPASGGCDDPWISADGRYVVFESNSTTLVPNDTNGALDVFIHDRFATGFSSLCVPGVDNVLACPCGNAPGGPDRGCDNSSATGGARLTAGGIAYLSLDSLVLTTRSELPHAASILLEGDALLANGSTFGQGVRCVGGTPKRLFVKTASNGGISVPDFGAGDPTISARSAQVGAPLLAGQPYFYAVYYRDPLVLGGCPAASTFNTTQTGRVVWWP